MSGSRIRASTSATGVSGATISGWEVIRPPAVVGLVAQQPPQVRGLDRLHRGQQPLPLLGAASRPAGPRRRRAPSPQRRRRSAPAPGRPAAGSGPLRASPPAGRPVPRRRRAAASWLRRLGGMPSTAVGQVGRCISRRLASWSASSAGLEQLGVLVPGHDGAAAVAAGRGPGRWPGRDLPAASAAARDGRSRRQDHGPVAGGPPVQVGGEDLPGAPGEPAQVDGAAAQVRARGRRSPRSGPG